MAVGTVASPKSRDAGYGGSCAATWPVQPRRRAVRIARSRGSSKMATAVSPARAQAWHSGPRRRSASAEVGQCSDTKTSRAQPRAVRLAMVTGARPVPCTDSSGAGMPPKSPVPSACSADSIDQSQPHALPRRFPWAPFVGDCANDHTRMWALAPTPTFADSGRSAGGHPAHHPQQVFLAVERVVVGPRPLRYVTADRLVVAEDCLQHALAPGQSRKLLLQRTHLGRGDLSVKQAHGAVH